MALEITYKGTQIAQLTTNGNLTLETAGKYCEGNIGIAYTGGGGFDANGAVLKVVTSTGCTILVTGTNYSETHQQTDGFVRSGDANVTEHFFSIPTTAFGTITVKATNTYGDNTKTLAVDTASKVYEVLCGGTNIILNSTFGLQDGKIPSSYFTYQDVNKRLVNTSRYYPGTGDYAYIFSTETGEISVSAFDNIKITARSNGNAYIELRDVDIRTLATLTFNSYTGATSNAAISNKYYSTARLLYSKEILEITEIILT